MNKNNESLRKNVIIGHRRRKNLCLRCGRDIHENGEECVEVYNKADNRSKNIESEKIENNKIITNDSNTIIELAKDISETFIVTDIIDVVDTPKIVNEEKEIFQKLDDIIHTSINETSLSNISYISKMKKRETIKLQRDYVLVDISHSELGYRMEFSFIDYLCKKYVNHIVCIFGRDLDKSYTISEMMKLKHNKNIIEIRNVSEQKAIDYIYGSKYFFSYESKFTYYCTCYKLNAMIFKSGENVKAPILLPSI